jgi:hypothetical protein
MIPVVEVEIFRSFCYFLFSFLSDIVNYFLMSLRSSKGILLSSQYLKITEMTPDCVSFKPNIRKRLDQIQKRWRSLTILF